MKFQWSDQFVTANHTIPHSLQELNSFSQSDHQ